jgi:hypothetical protein
MAFFYLRNFLVNNIQLASRPTMAELVTARARNTGSRRQA